MAMTPEERIELILIENIRLANHNDLLMMKITSSMVHNLKNGDIELVIEILMGMHEYYKNKIARS